MTSPKNQTGIQVRLQEVILSDLKEQKTQITEGEDSLKIPVNH